MSQEIKVLDEAGLSTLWSLIKDKIGVVDDRVSGLPDGITTEFDSDKAHLSIAGFSDATDHQVPLKSIDSNGIESFAWVDLAPANIGYKIGLVLDSSTYQLKAQLLDKDNNVVAESNIVDLPLESVVVDGYYDENTKSLILILKNGNIITIPVEKLIKGLATQEWVLAQGFLTEHQKIKTINGESLIGEGDIEIEASGKVDDVKVNGTSVVDEDKVANIDLTPYAKTADLKQVAFSGSYNDLSDKPEIPEVKVTDVTVDGTSVLDGTVAKIDLSGKQDKLTAGDNIKIENNKVSVVDLSKVAKSNDYNDLDNKPTIPTIDYPVTDVKVNGTSVLSNKVANITTIKDVQVSTYGGAATSVLNTITQIATVSIPVPTIGETFTVTNAVGDIEVGEVISSTAELRALIKRMLTAAPVKYSTTVNSTGSGTGIITISPSGDQLSGTTITISAVAGTDCSFDSYTVVSGGVTLTTISEGKVSFVIGTEDVVINCKFNKATAISGLYSAFENQDPEDVDSLIARSASEKSISEINALKGQTITYNWLADDWSEDYNSYAVYMIPSDSTITSLQYYTGLTWEAMSEKDVTFNNTDYKLFHTPGAFGTMDDGLQIKFA